MFQLFPHEPAKPGEAPLLPITALYVPYGQIDRVLPYLVRRYALSRIYLDML